MCAGKFRGLQVGAQVRLNARPYGYCRIDSDIDLAWRLGPAPDVFAHMPRRFVYGRSA